MPTGSSSSSSSRLRAETSALRRSKPLSPPATGTHSSTRNRSRGTLKPSSIREQGKSFTSLLHRNFRLNCARRIVAILDPIRGHHRLRQIKVTLLLQLLYLLTLQLNVIYPLNGNFINRKDCGFNYSEFSIDITVYYWCSLSTVNFKTFAVSAAKALTVR